MLANVPALLDKVRFSIIKRGPTSTVTCRFFFVKAAAYSLPQGHRKILKQVASLACKFMIFVRESATQWKDMKNFLYLSFPVFRLSLSPFFRQTTKSRKRNRRDGWDPSLSVMSCCCLWSPNHCPARFGSRRPIPSTNACPRRTSSCTANKKENNLNWTWCNGHMEMASPQVGRVCLSHHQEIPPYTTIQIVTGVWYLKKKNCEEKRSYFCFISISFLGSLSLSFFRRSGFPEQLLRYILTNRTYTKLFLNRHARTHTVKVEHWPVAAMEQRELLGTEKLTAWLPFISQFCSLWFRSQ